MTRQAHPNTLGALSALADLDDQHGWLTDDLLVPGRRRKPARPSLGAAARAVLNRQARAERQDQTATLKAGGKPQVPGKAPLDLTVLQAQMLARETAHDAATVASSALRSRPMLAYPAARHGTDEQRFTLAVAYLHVALRVVDPALAGELGTDLAAAARTCARASGHDPDRRDFRRGPCPACGRDTLVVQTVSTHEPALIQCARADCKCRGIDCLCRRPGRTPGVLHMWRSDEFEQLRRRLEAA